MSYRLWFRGYFIVHDRIAEKFNSLLETFISAKDYKEGYDGISENPLWNESVSAFLNLLWPILFFTRPTDNTEYFLGGS